MLPLLALSTAACNDWLNTTPVTQRTQQEMFSSQNGFKDALTGCYIGMMDESAYGRELTMKTIEHLVWSYTVTSNSTNQYLNLQNWYGNGVAAQMTSIFDKLYNIIASCNSILDNIDAQKSVFTTTGLYELIKGEALALRAYCHFDLLRLWGPVPTLADDNALVLPYVTRFTYKATPYSTYADFYKHVLDDLKEAADLLVDIDPVIADVTYTDTYFSNRQFRMNYYAVKGVMARVYMWEDNREDALACALEVINAENITSTTTPKAKLFTLGNSVAMSGNNLTFSSEHLFALYKFNLPATYDSYYGNGTLYRGTAYTGGILNQLYESSATDIRAPNIGQWWKIVVVGNGANYVVVNKYNSVANPTNRVPLIRLAEIYLIAAEAHPDEDYAEGLPYFNTYLTSRNVALSVTSRTALITNLKKQYRKEFYAEGLAWYVFKRFNSPRTDILWATTTTYVPNYVVPLPASEPLQ